MSTQQQKSELLASGYVKRRYNGTIPFPLVELTQLFYDDWIYWILKTTKFKQFANAKANEKIVCPKSFKIKAIEFEMYSYSNVCIKDKLTGGVMIGLRIKYLPSNIESCAFYLKIKGEQMNSLLKTFCLMKKDHTTYCETICDLSELKDLKYICFDYLINIKYIKYKKECDKINYFSPIQKIQKHSKFAWNIPDLLFEKCKKMIYGQSISPDNFDNNNWCLKIFPQGMHKVGESEFGLQCLHFPRNIKSMDVKIKYDINGTVREYVPNFSHGITGSAIYATSFNEFIKQESISFSVSLEIINVYNENDEIIEENKYEKYGIIVINT